MKKTKIKNKTSPSETPINQNQNESIGITEQVIKAYVKSKEIHLSEGEISGLFEFYQTPEVASMLRKVQNIQENIHTSRIRKFSVIFGTAGICFILILFGVDILEPKALTFYGLLCLAFGVLVGSLYGATNPNYRNFITSQCTQAKVFLRLAQILNTKNYNLIQSESILSEIPTLVQHHFLKSFDHSKQERVCQIECDTKKDGVSLDGYQFISTTQGIDPSGRKIDVTVDNCYLFRASFSKLPSLIKNSFLIKKNKSRSPGCTKTIHMNSVFSFALYGILLAFLFPMFGNISVLTFGIIGVMVFLVLASIRKFQISQNPELQKIQTFEKLFQVQHTDMSVQKNTIPSFLRDQLLKITKKQGNIFEFFFEKDQVYVKRNIGQYEFLSLDTKAMLPENQTIFIDWYIEMKEIVDLLENMLQNISSIPLSTDLNRKKQNTGLKMPMVQVL